MRRLWLPLLCGLLLLVSAGCDRGRETVPGVLLITLDTTRADHLGCYGYEPIETPNLDRLASLGVLFEQAQTTVPVTLPAHSTMFTGQYPAVHGVRYNGMFKLGDGSVTVAERLGDAGWSTVGMPASYPLTTSTGVGQGFQVYRDLFEEVPEEEIGRDGERNAGAITDQAIEWLSGRSGNEPFFLWLHYWDAHTPYQPPYPFSSTYRDRPYDGEIAYMDQEIGRLMAYLEDQGLDREILILVAGDHGEGLFDHGEKMHANLVYQSTMQVPLIARAPDSSKGFRVSEPVSLVDIAPTILDYAGLDPGPQIQGVSLREALKGVEPEPRTIYFEALSGSLSFGWSPLEGLRRGRWKYIRSSGDELYDLEEDPREVTDLHSTNAIRTGEFGEELQAMLEAWADSPDVAEATEVPLDPEELEMLASLGYVGGTLSRDSRGGVNPRDMIHLDSTIHSARAAQQAGQYAESLPLWELVLKEDPENRHALNLAVIAATHLSRFDQAQELGERLTARWPDFVPGHVAYGEAFAAADQFRKAADCFRNGLALHPDEDALAYRYSVALVASGQLELAERVSRTALDGGSGSYYRILLAVSLAAQGRPQEGEAELRQAIADGYERKSVLREEPLLEPLRRLSRFEDIISVLPDPPEDDKPDAAGGQEAY
ncbi:MAG: sulfatase-like hydrolase/transferase [Acidobacteria bacterium]|uniref:Sulfatase-like hydrolase/transferase n=1 Tax=Candidatus Polarisedimenticola svalbardensis TaxID=2886004 RepID=A0A8J6Y8G6_9BACT|nr:sulfatase-like hydrolase/transferase [Candidatus Polarisedimenticola svalbardensis]